MATSVLPPPTPYDRTSLRPAWPALPASFRAALAARLGSHVTQAQVTGTGFTSGFAAVLTTASAGRYLIKAAPSDQRAAEWYAQEAGFTSVLPSSVPTKPLLWSENLEGYLVVCLEAIEGARVPKLPWDPSELSAALAALAEAHAALASPPPQLLALEPPPWRGAPPPHQHGTLLAKLEAGFDELTRSSRQLLHCDLHLDNVVIDSWGKAWICDWNFLSYGPPWFDTVTLLLSAEASGLDPDQLFWAHPSAADASPEALDGALAAVLGYYLHASAQPEIPTSPHVRSHQRYYGLLAWRWLSRRLALE